MLEFGPYRLDPERRRFLRDGEPYTVQAKLFDTLVHLVENRDRVVAKGELLDAVWPDTHVEEATLFQTVSALRKALGGERDNGEPYITTVPGHGYRFIAAVTKKSAADPGKTALPGDERRRERQWGVAAAGLVAIAAVALVVSFLKPTAAVGPEPVNVRIQRITSLQGLEWQPGWSPDGRSFAYVGTAGDSQDIYIAAKAGGDPLQRTSHPADEIQPRWSPNGRYIAFLSDRGQGVGVYVMSPYEGPSRKIADTNLHRDVALLSGLGAQPWSADSDSLLIPRRLDDGRIAVWKFELSTGLESQVTDPPPGGEDREASWSFQGDRIAFRGKRDGNSGVWIADASGRVEKLAADTGGWPAWSPDDAALYLTAARQGPGNVWRVDLSSGAWSQITRGAGQDLFPAVASTGELAYSSFSHDLHIYRTFLESGETERLVDGTGRHVHARVSPDGTRIVYQSGRSGSADIWVMDLATGDEVQLTRHPGGDTRPDWSPDGKSIVFRSSREGASQLWILDADGGAPKRVSSHSIPVFGIRTASVEANAEPRWSPDGSRISYIAPTEDGFMLWLVRLEGDAEPEPIEATRGAINFGWYLDADRIILTRIAEDGEREMVAMNLSTGEERVLHRGPHYELSVAADGSMVSFSYDVSHLNQSLHVMRLTEPADGLPRAAGEPRQITDGKGVWHIHNGGLSPDGEWAVYTRDSDEGDIFLIEQP